MFQVSIWSLPSLAALCVAVVSLRLVRVRRHAAGAPALLCLCLCVVLWSLGQFVASLVTDLDFKLFASALQYPAIPLLPVAWLAFALTYTRRIPDLGRKTLAVLCAPVFVSTLLAWTHPWQNLLWASAELVQTPSFVGLALTYGPWFPVQVVYSYGAIAIGTFIIVYELSISPGHRRALAAVLMAPMAVAAMNIAYLTGFSVHFIDPTPLGFALGSLIIAYGVLQRGLLELSPGLHRQIIAHLTDPVLVLDALGRVLDLNPAASRQLPLRGKSVVGAQLDTVWPGHPFPARPDDDAERREVILGERAYHVRVSRLGGDPDSAARALLFHDITERLRAEAELRAAQLEMERLAFSDPLTGLHNRRSFMQRLDEECERSRRQQQPVSVILLDLDEFKSVNDSRGHEAGDQALCSVARLIHQSCRTGDVAGRIGGEEFAVLLPGSFLEGARRLAERLRQVLDEHRVVCPEQEPFRVTASIGVAGPGADAELGDPDAAELLRRADGALYRAKGAGRNRVCAAEYPAAPAGRHGHLPSKATVRPIRGR